MQGRHLLLGALHSLAGAADLLLSCTRLRQGGRARVQGPGRRAGPAPRVQGAAALGCHLQARASARSARLPRAQDRAARWGLGAAAPWARFCSPRHDPVCAWPAGAAATRCGWQCCLCLQLGMVPKTWAAPLCSCEGRKAAVAYAHVPLGAPHPHARAP